MMRAPIDVDPGRWIRVPLDFAEERWTDAGAWASWVAQEAVPGDARRRESIRAIALALAELDSLGAVVRYWHFPDDGEPGAALDVSLAVAGGDELLPAAPDRLVVEPLESALEVPGFDRAARRRSLVPVGDGDIADAPVLALVEWAAAVDGIVVGMTAADTDPSRLSRLVADGDDLLAGLDGRALARMVLG
ncbi:hypothetical protein OVN20_04360 [Microcella daejeonensis]|uniref:hypothetical protein n=1 Tax=Microcella daejeonensis TaxID=2994971 RepID=UPI00227175EE|nr:hypothetical protein [Microcella daejeonensis]WAB84805.1 hypothetical protein OVN20_04360 [Microcella daejeonensis]